MKRRVALLLAAVLTMSLAPMNVSAATYSNRLLNVPTVGAKTLLFENGMLGSNYLLEAPEGDTNKWPEWYVDGTDLILPLQENVSAGYQFQIQLTKAKWFFKNRIGTTADNTSARLDMPRLDDMYKLQELFDFSQHVSVGSKRGPLEYLSNNILPAASAKYVTADSSQPNTTYNLRRGIFFKGDATSDNGGTYYRFYQKAKAVNPGNSAAINNEVPYQMIIDDHDNTIATLTVLDLADGTADATDAAIYGYEDLTTADDIPGVYRNIGATGTAVPAGAVWEIRIPLVSLTDDEDVDVEVTVSSGNASTITSYRAKYATTAKSDTKSTVDEVAISRDEFMPGDFVIRELRPGTIRPKSGESPYTYIILDLPYGYHWKTSGDTKVGLQSGLAWSDGRIGLGSTVVTGSNQTSWVSNSTTWFSNDVDYQLALGQSNAYGNDKLYPGTSGGTYGLDSTRMIVRMNNIKMSTQLAGKVYITGLYFYADENAAMPAADGTIDIKVKVTGSHITEEEVLIGQRKEWNIGLKVTNTVPTLVSGRYIGASWSGVDADNNTHKTAHVQVYENTAYSWWGSRTTVLSLPATDDNNVKGAKFRKIEVTATSNLSTDSANSLRAKYSFPYYNINTVLDTGVYLNDGQKHGNGVSSIMVDNNKISISNVTVSANKRASVDLDLWVSIELGFGEQSGGDLKLAIDPSTTSLAGVVDKDKLPSVVIAHVVDPIKVTTKVSDLKIGYQYQNTSDIQITENGPGYLLRDKTVRLSITDLISSDMYFTPDSKIAVTTGDLKIKNITTTGSGGFTSQSTSYLGSTGTGALAYTVDGASLAFDIDRASTVASTITLSNVAVKLDRNVPVTNKSAYQALVWGTAIAENYGLTSTGGEETINGVKYSYGSRTWKADFNTAGVSVAYINVVSAAPDEANILSQEVQVPIGKNYFIVNGISYSMDAEAYVSPASNSTMVPIRFTANAFGLRNENQIVWDNANKTVSIIAPNRIIQFTAGKSAMILNGASITMQSPDGLPVVPEIKGEVGHERMYIPFRALGEAFGVPVDWDAETQTAIYNKGASTNTNLPVSNENPSVSS